MEKVSLSALCSSFPLISSLILELCSRRLSPYLCFMSPGSGCPRAHLLFVCTPKVEKEEEEKGGRGSPLKCSGDMYPFFKHDI